VCEAWFVEADWDISSEWGKQRIFFVGVGNLECGNKADVRRRIAAF
jgi:hypothetical protein